MSLSAQGRLFHPSSVTMSFSISFMISFNFLPRTRRIVLCIQNWEDFTMRACGSDRTTKNSVDKQKLANYNKSNTIQLLRRDNLVGQKKGAMNTERKMIFFQFSLWKVKFIWVSFSLSRTTFFVVPALMFMCWIKRNLSIKKDVDCDDGSTMEIWLIPAPSASFICLVLDCRKENIKVKSNQSTRRWFI